MILWVSMGAVQNRNILGQPLIYLINCLNLLISLCNILLRLELIVRVEDMNNVLQGIVTNLLINS